VTRVVHLSTSDSSGGATRAAFRLHTGLRRAGVESTMLVEERKSGDPHVRQFLPPSDIASRVRRRMRRAAIAKDAAGKRPFADDRDRIVAAGGERVGTQKLGGQDCDLYRVTDGDGRRETCVTPGGLPVRTEMWHRASGASSSASYLSWASQMQLPDEFFEPGPGVTLEEYGYDQYLEAVRKGPVGPAPPLHSYLLHGK